MHRRGRTFADAVAELARTLDAVAEHGAGAEVRAALEQVERERWAAERRRAVLELDDEGDT